MSKKKTIWFLKFTFEKLGNSKSQKNNGSYFFNRLLTTCETTQPGLALKVSIITKGFYP